MAEGRITYRAKKEIVCPVCDNRFSREELLIGGGRMNAGELTDELHRVYLPTKKYGDVHPLIYPVTVCPRCWYAAYPRHFEELESQGFEKIRGDVQGRKNILKPIFPDLDFDAERGLAEGIASYMLAAFCYEHRIPKNSPTFYRGLSFLRAGWLAKNLHKQQSEDNFDYLAEILLRKASFFYSEILHTVGKDNERIEDIPNHGPDQDNNYGFDGVLYLIGVLVLKYGSRDDVQYRRSALKAARAAVSRIVGMGQSTKSKPSALLDLGRALHKAIKKELNEDSDDA